MTFKEKFIRIHRNRGYHVEETGKMVILSLDNYRAIHFFNEDGTRDESQAPFWKLDRP